MKTVKQRKVLILGGIKHMIEAVQIAKKMGMYVIVTDNNVGSPAKKFADKAYGVSTANTEKLAEIAKEEKIDGVFTAYDDIDTWNALKLCKKMDLPFYATNEQFVNTSNKEKFKEFCRTFNVPIIEECTSDKILWDKIEFPAIAERSIGIGSGIRVYYTVQEDRVILAEVTDNNEMIVARYEPYRAEMGTV